MNRKYSHLKIISGVLLFLGILFISIGFYKKGVYSNREWEKQNAYVGGDAYNYIINSAYFTGYVTLGSVISLGATVLYATAILIDSMPNSIVDSNISVQNLRNNNTTLNQSSEEELPDIT